MSIVLISFGSRSLAKHANQNLIVDQAFRIFLRECRDYGLSDEIKLVRHGAAPGADILMGQWAIDQKIAVDPCPAKWNDWRNLPKEKKMIIRRDDGSGYNALAGFNRNKEMIAKGFDAGLGIRMPGKSNGTDDMSNLIKATGKPLMMYYAEIGKHEWL